MQQEFVDLYAAEQDLQTIYGDEKMGGANGVASPLPFLQYVNYKGFAQGQAGFAKTFVLPTWESLARLMPRLQFLVDRINQNI